MPPYLTSVLLMCMAARCFTLPDFTLQKIKLTNDNKETVAIWKHDYVTWNDLKANTGIDRSYPLCYVINGYKKGHWDPDYVANSWYSYTLQNSQSKKATTTKFLIKGYTQTGIINWVAWDGVCDGKGSRDSDTYYSQPQPGTKVKVDWLDGIGPFTRCYYEDDGVYDFRDVQDKLFFAHGKRLSDTTVECPRCTKPKWITKSDIFFPSKSSGIPTYNTPFWIKEIEACISCEFDASVCGIDKAACNSDIYGQITNSEQCSNGLFYRTCDSVSDIAGEMMDGNSGSTLKSQSFLYSHGSCRPCSGMENIRSMYAIAAGPGNINSPDSCKVKCNTGYYPSNSLLIDSSAYFALNELVQGNIRCERCRTCEEYQYISGDCGSFKKGVLITNPCTNCPKGQEPNPSDRTGCISCRDGKYRQREMNAPCLKCPPLQFSNIETDWEFCLNCMPYQELLQTPNDLLGYGCADCAKGTFKRTRGLKQTCESCSEGSIGTDTLELRDNEKTACTPCTDEYPERCLSTVQASTPLCVSNSNKTECIKCPASQFPNAGFMCETCNDNERRFPNNSVAEYVTDYRYPCEWRCLQTLYLDTQSKTCQTCHVPCSDSVSGLYRPYCFAGQNDLPTCQPCSNRPGNKTDRFVGVNFEYSGNIIQMSPQEVCKYYCKIGYNASDDCSACSAPPSNAHHSSINDCGWTCNRGYKLSADAKSCEACDSIDYPRRTIDRLKYVSSLPYYGNNAAQKVNFSICHDNDMRVYGEIQARLAGEVMCGNGLIELSDGEECDDGNTKSGDGCSNDCKLENTFYFCDKVGESCLPNCGYTENEMRFRYLSDPLCTYSYQYSSNRTLDLKLCGSDCETQGKLQLLDMKGCTSINRGCQDCDPQKQYQARNTNECRECGSDCRSGFFPIDICVHNVVDITALGAFTQSQLQLTLAQFDASQYPEQLVLQQASIGCLPCSPPQYANVSSPSTIRFVSRGNRMLPQSCAFLCRFENTAVDEPNNYYCTDLQNNRCAGACIPCSDGLQSRCETGQYLSVCTETEPPSCKNCSLSLLNQVYEPTATIPRDSSDCKTKCDGDSILDPHSQTCKKCIQLNETTCNHDEYAAACTRPSSTDANATLEEFGYTCRKCPYVTVDLSNPNDNKVPVQWFGSPRLCTMDCEQGNFHRNGYQPSAPYEKFQCYPCSSPSQKCQQNERYVPCTQLEDTACEPCPDIPVTSKLEYYVPDGQYPTCATRCVEGNFFNKTSSQCESCLPSLCPCQEDKCFKTDNDCILGYQRLEPPACIQCNDNDKPKNAVWVQSGTRKCVWECIAGTAYNPSVRECVTQMI